MTQQKEKDWTRLDNASRIFPSTYNEKDPKVFRIACELKEAVDPQILQEALDLNMENFPLFRSVLRRGIFWYYLEASNIFPRVEPETKPLCAPIYLGHKRNLLFRVSYYQKRINLEVFHVLADGTGALCFIQSLVTQYLLLRHKNEYAATSSLNKAAISMQMADSFDKYSSGDHSFLKKKKGKKKVYKGRAYHIRGVRLPDNNTRLIEGAMSTQAVLGQAHLHHTTLTRFITALLVYAIYKEMPARKLKSPLVLSVPINLRQFFDSETTRNFFSTIDVGYDFQAGSADLTAVIEAISESFQRELTEERLRYKLNRFVPLAKNPLIRVMPLQWKNVFLRIGSWFADRRITSGISNIGQINMPDMFSSHLRQFSVCTHARSLRVTLCSYRDHMVVSFTSPHQETDIQRTFFRLLTEMGIDVEISANL